MIAPKNGQTNLWRGREKIRVYMRVYVVLVFSIGSILLLICLNIDILIELVFLMVRAVGRVYE